MKTTQNTHCCRLRLLCKELSMKRRRKLKLSLGSSQSPIKWGAEALKLNNYLFEGQSINEA
jgi:hypothetical protein